MEQRFLTENEGQTEQHGYVLQPLPESPLTTSSPQEGVTPELATEKLPSTTDRGELTAKKLEDAIQGQHKQNIGSVIWSFGILIILCVAVPLITYLLANNLGAARMAIIAVFLVILVPIVPILYFAISKKLQNRKMARQLVRTDDLQLVGPLVRSLKVESLIVRNFAKESLTELLPKLQANNASLLGDEERATLIRQLDIAPDDKGYRDLNELFSRSATRREINFRLAILKAYEQIGGQKELSTVERLSQGRITIHSPTKILPEIIAAAEECLPYLKARAQEENVRMQLLRPSSSQDQSPATLLRPSYSSADDSPEELLRPTDIQQQD